MPTAVAAAAASGVAVVARDSGPIEVRRWPCVERHTQQAAASAGAVGQLSGHGGPVAGLGFAAGGGAVVSVGADRAALVWERTG